MHFTLVSQISVASTQGNAVTFLVMQSYQVSSSKIEEEIKDNEIQHGSTVFCEKISS